MDYCDESNYAWHEKDMSGSCFTCGKKSERLSVVRHIASMRMVHMCPDCMVDKMSEYLLDNTREWKGPKAKGD